MSATKNSHAVSFNVQDTLPLLLRMVDPTEFSRYYSMTPTTLDYLANYNNAVQDMDWQLDIPMTTTYPTDPIVYVPGKGDTEPLSTATTAGIRPVGWKSYANNMLAYDMNRPAGTAYYHKPRGSLRVKLIWARDCSDNQIVPNPTGTDVYVKFKVTEPLLLSSFIFGSGYGKQGFYGIQSITLRWL